MIRTAVITGVAGGIGAATALAFRTEGWRVVGLDRCAPGEGLVDRFVKADLSDLAQLLEALDKLAEEPRVDALVNNAASAMDKRFTEVTLEDWQHTQDVNVRAAFFATQRLLPALQERRGAVVNVASVHALATSAGASAYAASKGALVALTRSIAVEMGPSGIRANAVLPGAVDTPMLRAGLTRSGSVTDLDMASDHGPGTSAEASAYAASGGALATLTRSIAVLPEVGTPMLRPGVVRTGDSSGDVDGALAALAARTPLRSIGKPADIAQGILFLADTNRSAFVTGQVLVIDGGATARLSTE